jgi:hypothetical protein
MAKKRRNPFVARKRENRVSFAFFSGIHHLLGYVSLGYGELLLVVAFFF